jgi:hypothetical protein
MARRRLSNQIILHLVLILRMGVTATVAQSLIFDQV